MIERFFGEAEKGCVEAAVRDAEARSFGQIVPLVVERSSGYPEARYRGAILAAALATAVVLGFHLPIHLAVLVVIQAGAGFLGASLAFWGPAERVLAGRVELELAARDRALRAFHEQGLHRTANGTGVLVFASLFERRAVVLGDHGIDAKMGPGDWQKAVDALTTGLRRGDPASGFCEAIALCGARLAEHFPRTAGEVGVGNELPDALRTSRS